MRPIQLILSIFEKGDKVVTQYNGRGVVVEDEKIHPNALEFRSVKVLLDSGETINISFEHLQCLENIRSCHTSI